MATKTIWDFMTIDGNPAVAATTAPYAAATGTNYYQLYANSTRSTRKREHAVSHCLAMARYCYENSRFPQGCDWLVAASAHVDNETELLPRILQLWNTLDGESKDSWSDRLTRLPQQLDRRLVGFTFLRVLESANAAFPREVTVRLLEFIHQTLPDICSQLDITDDAPDFDQIREIKSLSHRLLDLLGPIIEASHAGDLDSVLLRHHGILQSLHRGLVPGLLTPHLPAGFIRTTLPAVLKCIEELVASRDTRFVEVASRTRNEISVAIDKLVNDYTFYGLEFLLPLLEHLRALVKARLESSDATKPASVSVDPYPRKYPFHAKGRNCRLRFQVHNRGPGPATDLELSFTFWADVEPLEARRTIPELELGRCLIDVDVQILESITEPWEYDVKCSWRNYDATYCTFDGRGQLEIQNPNVDWDALTQGEPYSMEAIQIDSDRPFIGRDTDLLQLVRAIASKSMGSAYVYGQKRVGKTSLALAAAKRAQSEVRGLFPIYLEGGDYVRPSAEGTLQELGRIVARRISKCGRALDGIPLPAFTDSLSPLNEYVDEVLEALPDSRWLLLLDEFDELPLELYKRGPVADGLFLTLRALSGRPRVGIVLIGGEVAVHSVREERAFGKSIISYSPAARRSRGSQSDVPIEGRGEAPFAESFDRNIEVGTG